MKITMKVQTENYDKSIVIDDEDVKIYNNKAPRQSSE